MSFTQYCEHGGVVCQECVIAKDAQIAALEKDIIRLTGAWVAEEQKVAALEEELEWHRDADRQDYIRTGGRSSSKLLEEIAALEAEVERLKHWLVASPAQMSVGGGRLLPIDSTGMRTLIDERAPFVALAKAANALLFNGIEAVETALAHPAVQRAVTG